MKVLCGLFEPSGGKVFIDNIEIRQLGVNNYHKMIACVMQDDKLFSGSIRENICGFTENPDEQLMIACAQASYIHNVIISMPMGYETLIGELGEGLSGGQKQRIFIARALYRKPASCLWTRPPAHWIKRVNLTSIRRSANCRSRGLLLRTASRRLSQRTALFLLGKNNK